MDARELGPRFYSKTVEVAGPLDTPCLIWTARIDDNGKGRQYGRYWIDGAPRIAYVVSCAAKEGKTFDEMKSLVVLHECDTPLCVNPAHIHSGTQSENMKDMYDKGRGGGFIARHYAKEA